MSYNLFKFPPKNDKNKKQKNLSLLVFFFWGGALSQVRTFAKKTSQEPNPKQKEQKVK